MARTVAKHKKGDTEKKRSGALIFIAVAAIIGVAITLIVVAKKDSGQSGSAVAGNTGADGGAERMAKSVAYEVVAEYPHDPQAFLQGLIWHDGGFYESTGQYGQSSLRRVEFPSGKVLRRMDLDSRYFGEGLAMVGDHLVQLTWQSHKGFVYDRDTFKVIREFTYNTEGWGLTYDGKNLILSDGSDTLTYLDSTSFEPIKRLRVTMDGRPVRQLNELEWVEGEIWANVWYSDVILRIDPATGKVHSFLDLKGILKPDLRTGNEDVLNGIAYDPERKRVFVSGKLWPKIFEIRLK